MFIMFGLQQGFPWFFKPFMVFGVWCGFGICGQNSLLNPNHKHGR
jgi:hypothetical protein